MKDNGTRVSVYGKQFTGWKADLIVYTIVSLLLGAGYIAGWRTAVNSIQSVAAHD